MGKKLVCISIFFFAFGSTLGIFSAYYNNYSAYFGFDPFDNSNPGALFFFEHNLKVAFLLWAGAITLGITTLVNLFSNGFILGSAVKTVENQLKLTETLLLILPHGIFEIPGLIIAGAAGFKIPYELLRFALGKKEEILTEEDAKEFFKLVGISIVLIFIAAIVESTITLWIAENIVEGVG
ncbi:stage II sporulation protein M [Thermococcus sp.]|uniref:stage II sporulation protein M n=1 Tax=Thermococcus sp. TaxID=35749 RepID=UPI0019CC83C3|nr:stage II sporulation protein M [Thermococcus sp.]MBC7095452.1 stage II sporulation protein M [Thermococcus sp.]